MSNLKLEFSRGETIAEKYEVVDHLEESPLGMLYRAKHLKTGTYVRLLMLRPSVAGRDQKDQLLDAYKTAKGLQHPNLLNVGELGEHEGVAYYTMEDFEGASLRSLLQEYKVGGKQFAVNEAAQVVTQILEALKAGHDLGLTTLGLRPEYVLISVRYTGPRRQNFVAQVKVLGIGLWGLVPAAVLAEDEFSRGEAQYLAPELKSFEPVATPRCDVYSVGVIYYEMLTGTAPVGTFQAPRSKRPDLPERVNDVVELALANSPEDRYPTAQDFINDIQRTFQETHVDSGPKPLMGPLGWVLAFTLVLFVTVIAFYSRPDPAKAAEAADSQIRKEVIDAHDKPSAEEVRSILERHPKNMVYVPPGPYITGRLHGESRETAHLSEPLATVVELEGFLIDIFEYPNLPNAAPKYDVPYADAERLCSAQGKRLCTDTEWEKACKGPRNLAYSYGDVFDPEFCGDGISDLYLSGQKAGCKTGWGAFDMSGNFREWTASMPQGKDSRRIVKGGQKGAASKGTRCATSSDESMLFSDGSLSFRCCRDPNAPPPQTP